MAAPGNGSATAAARTPNVLQATVQNTYIDDTLPINVNIADVTINKKFAVSCPWTMHEHARFPSSLFPFHFLPCRTMLPQEYHVCVTRGLTGDETWTVMKRYSEFDELNAALQSLVGCELPMPPKKMFGTTDRAFVAERQKSLEVNFF
jgi:hypothetical protein